MDATLKDRPTSLLEDEQPSANREAFAPFVTCVTSSNTADDAEFESLVCSIDPAPVAAEIPAENRHAAEMGRLQQQLASLRNWLLVLCGVAMVWVISFAQAILIPLAMSVVLYLLLRPAVRWLGRRRIPEAVGAALCLLVVGIALVVGILPLIGPATEWLNHLPEHLQNADQKIKVIRDQFGQFAEIQTRLNDLTTTEEEPRTLTVAVQQPELTSSTMMLSTTGNTLGMLVVVVVLAYFLLITGDQLINNVLSILPTFHEKRQTVELILDV